MALTFSALAPGSHIPQILTPSSTPSAPRRGRRGCDTPAGIVLLSTGAVLCPRLAGGGRQGRQDRQRNRAVRRVAEVVDVAQPDAMTRRHEEASAETAGDSLPQLVHAPAKQKKTKSFRDCLDIVNMFENSEMPAELHTGVQTGWDSVDELYRPVRGEVTVVTGTPGSGKSEFLLSLALNLAMKHDWRFVVVPFEHKQEDLAVQLIEKKQEVPHSNLQDQQKSGHFDLESDVAFLDDHLQRVGSYSEDMGLEDILSIAAFRARELKNQGGLHGLIIDPYNCIARPSNNDRDTTIVSQTMSRLQTFAKKHSTHVWIVVHPTKQSQLSGNAPSMYDCAGSAHWYNKCDNGIMVRRPFAKSWAQQRQTDCVGSSYQVDLKVDKVRNYYAGKCGTASLMFNPHTRGYEEMMGR